MLCVYFIFILSLYILFSLFPLLPSEPQSNGLPEEAHVSLGEEPSYPMEDEENTTPIEREVEEEVIHKGEGDKSAQLPGTWAARISQVNEGCGFNKGGRGTLMVVILVCV